MTYIYIALTLVALVGVSALLWLVLDYGPPPAWDGHAETIPWDEPSPPTPRYITSGDFQPIEEPPEMKPPPLNCFCPHCDTGGAVLTDTGMYHCLTCGNSFHFSSSLT